MPRSIKSKTVFIVSQQGSQGVQHMGALTSFRGAYQWILFKAGISTPNQEERRALAELRKTGAARVWNSAKFDSVEAAMWRPDAEVWWIAEIPIIRKGTESL
jgi:hypothetical protein